MDNSKGFCRLWDGESMSVVVIILYRMTYHGNSLSASLISHGVVFSPCIEQFSLRISHRSSSVCFSFGALLLWSTSVAVDKQDMLLMSMCHSQSASLYCLCLTSCFMSHQLQRHISRRHHHETRLPMGADWWIYIQHAFSQSCMHLHFLIQSRTTSNLTPLKGWCASTLDKTTNSPFPSLWLVLQK